MPNLARNWDPDPRRNAARAWYPPVGVQPAPLELEAPLSSSSASPGAASLIVAPSPEPCCSRCQPAAIAAPAAVALPASASLALQAAAPAADPPAAAAAWIVKREWLIIAAVIAVALLVGSKQ